MSYSVLTAKQDLTGILHGTTLNQILDINGLLNRTARQLLLDFDPQETKRIQQFTNPIFSSVYDYALPGDLKGNRVIDIRPQANRNPNEILGQNYNQYFDANKKNSNVPNFTINFNQGIKTIRMNVPFLPAGATLNACDSVSGNGVWTTGGSASNLTVNNVNFVAGNSSLKFDLSAGGASGYLENSTMTALDLSEQENQGTIFLWVYLPTGSDFSGVELRWGSSSSAYWSRTVTVNQTNNSFVSGWNLLAFNWLNAASTGGPDSGAINYLRVTYSYNGNAQTAVGLNSAVSRLGQILEIEYYSKYLFSTASGSWQETVSDDSNLVNLDTESYNLFLNLLAHFALQEQQGMNALRYDGTFFGKEYADGVKRYVSLYKTEVQKPQSPYYKRPLFGYNTWIGNWYNR